jgi:hypothetical protein
MITHTISASLGSRSRKIAEASLKRITSTGLVSVRGIPQNKNPVRTSTGFLALPILLLVTLLAQPFLALMRRHLVTFALFTARHATSFLEMR